MEQQRTALPDWAFPFEEEVPESTVNHRIQGLLEHLIQRFLAARGVEAFVSSDQLMYWDQTDPRRSLSPDVYVVLGVPQAHAPRSWMTWREGGRSPDLAVEAVSTNWSKDYLVGPARYAEAGVRELVIYDHETGPNRIRWQVYRRNADGDLTLAATSQGDRVWSEILGCFLRETFDPADELPRIRLGVGEHGDELVISASEGERWERAEKERERAEKERERQAKEQERAEKEQALADNEHLRADRDRISAEKEAMAAKMAELLAELGRGATEE
ncbi:MAG: Uma2 family endonuclease [Myxococcales bacterium]|nr:Uma2 family endonuclease [Myxococcales bacterium]